MTNQTPTAGSGASLKYRCGAVPSNDASQLTPALWLWVWSVSQRQWLLDTQPPPGNADPFGWSWSHGEQTSWMTALKLGVPPTLLLFTRTYTASGLR